MAVGFVASATSGSQASVASFNIGTLGTGARAGIVFVVTHNSATALDTGVTWNGVAMTLLYSAADTDTEPGIVRAYFLDNVTNGTITVARTNNATVCVGYAASISASGVTQAYQTITRVSSTQNTNANTSTIGTGASGEVAVDDGSPGTSSMRFAASYTGGATPVAQGTNSTALQSLDSTALGSSFVRETTAGQGSRNVGFATGTTDDWALVAVAVREAPPVVSLPTVAALTLTGATPTVAAPAISEPTAVALVLTGSTPTVAATNNVTALPTAAVLTVTGSAPAIVLPVAVAPTAASLAITGSVPIVTAPVLTQPSAVALVVTPATPTVVAPYGVAPSAAALAVTGATPAVTAPAVSQPTGSSLALTGATPVVALPVVSAPTAAVLALEGGVPQITTPVVASPGRASLVLAGAVPAVSGPTVVLPTSASLSVTGAVPAVDIAAPTAVVVLPGPRSLHLVGARPTVVVSSSEIERYLLGHGRVVRLEPVRVTPAGAVLRLVGATPEVVVIDDGDFLDLLALIA